MFFFYQQTFPTLSLLHLEKMSHFRIPPFRVPRTRHVPHLRRCSHQELGRRLTNEQNMFAFFWQRLIRCTRVCYAIHPAPDVCRVTRCSSASSASFDQKRHLTGMTPEHVSKVTTFDRRRWRHDICVRSGWQWTSSGSLCYLTSSRDCGQVQSIWCQWHTKFIDGGEHSTRVQCFFPDIVLLHSSFVANFKTCGKYMCLFSLFFFQNFTNVFYWGEGRGGGVGIIIIITRRPKKKKKVTKIRCRGTKNAEKRRKKWRKKLFDGRNRQTGQVNK